VAPTLVVSDLHLGSRLQRDVLRRPAARAALFAALDGVERLVLLGDTVELLEGRSRAALAIAEPVLRELGARLGPHREVVLVPGNHDRALIRAWLHDRARDLAIDAAIPAHASPALAEVVSWLAPARVSVRYPGLWLADGIYATHGHYLDRHLLPESAFGLHRRAAAASATIADYEHGPHMTQVEALLISYLPRRLGALADDIAGGLRGAVMASLPMAARRRGAHRLAPLNAAVLGVQMRRAAIPALVHVVERLGVEARSVIFGHVHRNGPQPPDDRSRWTGPSGAPLIFNTGCWVYEPLLLARARPPHPYWPGGAVLLEDGAPRAVRLLDDVPARELRSL
jgi:UDP-2,3-diacylglucosamine pyrophosphatase LpxH